MLQYPDICLESDRTRANWFSCNCCQSLCRQLGNRFVHRRRPYRAYKSGDCCNGTFWTRTKSTSQVSCGASIRPQKWLWWGEMHPQYQRLYTYGFECKGPVDSIEDNLQSSQERCRLYRRWPIREFHDRNGAQQANNLETLTAQYGVKESCRPLRPPQRGVCCRRIRAPC